MRVMTVTSEQQSGTGLVQRQDQLAAQLDCPARKFRIEASLTLQALFRLHPLAHRFPGHVTHFRAVAEFGNRNFGYPMLE